jgi:hypothetical protein
MFEKRKAKKLIEEKMEKDTPAVSSLVLKSPQFPKRRFKIWIIAGSAMAVTGLAIASGYGIYKALNPISSDSIDLSKTQLTKPSVRVYTGTVSKTSASIYEAFAKKLVPLIYAEAGTTSKAFSVFDAFVAVSMTVYCSNDAAQKEYCDLLGAADMDEVTTAVKELTLTLGVNSQYVDPVDGKTKTEGGASVNSFWFDDSMPLAGTANEILQGLQDDYFASIYHTRASTEKLTEWLSDNAPVGFDDLPKIVLDDDPETSSVSAFFVKDSFVDESSLNYLNQYKSKNHYLDYVLDDVTKEVDYIYSETDGYLLNGTNFTGIHSSLNKLKIDYYLPNNGYTPNDIISDVIQNNYTSSDEAYDFHVSAPYFYIKTEGLDFSSDLKEMASFFKGTLMDKLVNPSYSLELAEALQSSVLKYDYDGFYAVSVTVVDTESTSSGPVTHFPIYPFILDRPYVFQVNYPITLAGESTSVSLPLFYGQVFDPGYAAA